MRTGLALVRCGGALVSRTDDTEVIVKRLQEYETSSALHDYYENSQAVHITLSMGNASYLPEVNADYGNIKEKES